MPVEADAATAHHAVVEAPPLFAGRYRIERLLGRGGMGSVHLANQVAVNRLVAIKLLENASDDEVIVNRFKREARVIAQLQHPHIVNLIDFGTNEAGQLFLVMEYIDGASLKALIRAEAPLEPERVVEIGSQILDALAGAHAKHIIHRDLKPDNVMLATVRGRRDFVKLLDFGIAKIKRLDPGADNTVQTKAGLIVGSLRYISPEQVDTREITPRTDMYSLGVILYELLTGRPLFDYASPADCAIAHLTEPPKPPTLDGRRLRGPLVDFIMSCLDKDPRGRPADAQEGLERLQACRELALVEDDEPAQPGDDATRTWSLDERPTVQRQDAHASETVRGMPPAPAGPGAPRGASVASPTRQAVEAPGSREPGSVSLTDCVLDTPRAQRVASAPDVALGSPRTAATGAGSGLSANVLRAAPSARPNARRASLSPLWIVLALIGLAAIGAAIYVLVIHPAIRHVPTPAATDEPAEVAPAPTGSGATAP